MDALLKLLQSLKTTMKTIKPRSIKTVALVGLGVAVIASIPLIRCFILPNLLCYPGDRNERRCDSNALMYRNPANCDLQYTLQTIRAEDGCVLKGWHIKHKTPKQLIVYFHENAGNIGARLPFIKQAMNSIDTDFVIFAYRSFSESEDRKPNETGLCMDAVAILHKSIQLSTQRGVPLFIYGRSLGGAVTIDMARRGEFKNQIKGLILENTFTSIQDVVFSFIPNWLFPVKCYLLFVLTGVWMSLEKMKSISEDIPVLLIKSWQDQLVKKEQMDRLEAAFRLSKRRVQVYNIEQGAHNDAWVIDAKSYFASLNKFMLSLRTIQE